MKNLLNIFMKNREIAIEKHKDEFLECLEIGFQDKEHVYHLDICRDYFKILHQKGKLEELTRAAEEMSIVYNNNLVPLEWICKIYIENESFKISENLKANFGIYVERLLELNQNSLLGLMASGLVKFTIGDLAGARDVLVKGEFLILFIHKYYSVICFSQSTSTQLVDLPQKTCCDSQKTPCASSRRTCSSSAERLRARTR